MNSANNRVLAEVIDSPVGLSPMGNLAVNFSGTSLDSTPCYKFRGRRLSMLNLTPSSSLDNSSGLLDSSDGKCGTPRISKNTLTTFARRGSLMRRMNSAPSPSYTCDSETRHEGTNKKSGCDVVLVKFDPEKNSSPGKSLLKQDGDSMDSGFTEPCGIEISEDVSEPPKENPSQFSVYQSPSRRRKLSVFSFGSANYFDDGFLEVSDLEKSFTDENEELPVGMGNLLKGPLLGAKKSPAKDQEKGMPNGSRPPLRRFNSLMENYSSPASSKARVGLFLDEASETEETFSPCEKLPFKRPREIDVNSSKRRKSNSVHTISERFVREKSKSRYKLQRSISETAASSLSLMLHKSDLIADFTRPYALPIVSGRHEDLKSITPDTLAGLLNGDFSSKVDSFRIIDCRYPYEYEGGHIKGSINLYTREHVEQELFAGKSAAQDLDSSREESKSDERNILIFHCEFSLERGPALYRYLRRCDRNVSHYPTLHYPEVYLLHGGYENFFSTHKSLCEPCSYQPMVDPKHESDLRKFRIKSNSWSGDQKRNASKSGLKRLGLF